MPPDNSLPGMPGPPRRKGFFQDLSSRDRIRVEFVRHGGDVVELMVQLECETAGRWLPCRRYDSDHGLFHVHPEAWKRHPNRRDPIPVSNLNEALTLALSDLKVNWIAYREQLEADRFGDEA